MRTGPGTEARHMESNGSDIFSATMTSRGPGSAASSTVSRPLGVRRSTVSGRRCGPRPMLRERSTARPAPRAAVMCVHVGIGCLAVHRDRGPPDLRHRWNQPGRSIGPRAVPAWWRRTCHRRDVNTPRRIQDSFGDGGGHAAAPDRTALIVLAVRTDSYQRAGHPRAIRAVERDIQILAGSLTSP